MQCPRCHQENPPRARFCEECATPLTRVCPSCGTLLSPSAKFCSACARPVESASEAQPPFPAPDVELATDNLAALPADWVYEYFGMAAPPSVLDRSYLAMSLAQQTLTTHESAGVGFFQSMSIMQLGEAYLLAGHVEDARACADRAVRLTRQRGERGHEAWALRLGGETASHHDRPDVATAESRYGAAMALASELGMRPVAAHCHLGLGKLYRRTGKPEQAREHLTTATTMYREMGMGFWLEQAEAESRALA